MPIRPENRHRYPTDWPEISARIRHDRAGDRCECDGRCGHDHRAEEADGIVALGFELAARLATTDRCDARNGWSHPVTGSRVVLTVAHLDHQPEHSDDDNLLAMCQRCHLAYDREHHAETRARTRAGGPPLPFAPTTQETTTVPEIRHRPPLTLTPDLGAFARAAPDDDDPDVAEAWSVRCCTDYAHAWSKHVGDTTWAREAGWTEHADEASAVASLAEHLATAHGMDVRTVTISHVELDPRTDVDVATYPDDAAWLEEHRTTVEVER